MAEGDTVVNAVVGGVAAIVLSFVPLSPVLGGAVAGYLQGGTRNEGLRVGALAGVVAALPLAVGFFVLSVFFGVALVGMPVAPRAGGGVALVLVLAVFALVVAALYTVGLGALGGWLGNYVRYETDLVG